MVSNAKSPQHCIDGGRPGPDDAYTTAFFELPNGEMGAVRFPYQKSIGAIVKERTIVLGPALRSTFAP